MGWGEPAASGTVVSLDWAQCGQNVACSGATDHGDVYYIRSTDSGLTWGTPVKLNTDSGTAMQWQPSLTATSTGALYASWYDGREVNGGADLNCPVGSPNNCYRRWGRVSLDNGATWQPDAMVGSALTGLPAQPDANIQPTYEGDYDYHSSVGQTAIGGWTDGRVVISGNAQQDVFVSFVVGASPTASPTPTPSATASPTPSATFTPTPTIVPCSNYFTSTTTGNTIVPGVTDTGSHCDDCATPITFPFPVYFYGTSYTTANVSSNGSLDMTGSQAPFTHGCQVLPSSLFSAAILEYQDDLETVAGLPGCTTWTNGCGVFTVTTGTAPNRVFYIDYHTVHFANTSAAAEFEVAFYENQQTFFDIFYGATSDTGSDETSGARARSATSPPSPVDDVASG